MNRCGETDIDAAVAAAVAEAQSVAAAEPWGDTRIVGTRVPRVDAYDRVTGTATYPSDIALAGMLHAAVLRCPHAHARVRTVDTGRAERMPGVRAVIGGRTPGADIGWYDGEKGTLSTLFDAHCRFAGEEVAAVAADTPYQAFDAIRAITVEYEVLPFAVTEDAALAPGATPILRGTDNKAGAPQVYERGSIATGFAAADAVVEGTYSTSAELHVPIEPHGCVARWDGAKLTVWDSLQGVYPAQTTLAKALGLPLSRVRVIGHYVGGGFGSKLDTGKYSIIAALLARSTGRPVRLFLTREDTMLCMGNRPASRMTIKLGAKKDGTLTAIQFSCEGTGGAYSDGGTGLVAWLPIDLYRCANVQTESRNVYTNLGPERPFRAPGHPQGAWALEQAMDALAGRLGLDPVELRLRNVPDVSQGRRGQRYTTTGLRACIEEGAKAFGWAEARKRAPEHGPVRRGVGMASALWIAGGGGPPATVVLKLFADGSVNVNIGASDIGTGTKTVMSMVVAEELGVPLDRVQVELADAGTTQFATASGGSKTVPTEAPAVRAAALDVKRQLLALAAEQLKVDATAVALRDGAIVVSTDPAKRLELNAVQALEGRGVLVGIGTRAPNPPDVVVNPFAAHFAEVEVDTRTGEIRVLRLVAAHDSGRVMNRLTYNNQVFGGVTMGLGLALTEARVVDAVHEGRVLTANLHDYKVPTALDVPPEPVCVPVDLHDTACNAVGAKGLGEPSTIPTAAAVGNAVAHALGVRLKDAPMSPARVLEAVGAKS